MLSVCSSTGKYKGPSFPASFTDVGAIREKKSYQFVFAFQMTDPLQRLFEMYKELQRLSKSKTISLRDLKWKRTLVPFAL